MKAKVKPNNCNVPWLTHHLNLQCIKSFFEYLHFHAKHFEGCFSELLPRLHSYLVDLVHLVFTSYLKPLLSWVGKLDLTDLRMGGWAGYHCSRKKDRVRVHCILALSAFCITSACLGMSVAWKIAPPPLLQIQRTGFC